jgi:hypothetical protein
MRLLIFIAVIIGIAVVFGLVYGISALLERKRNGAGSTPNRRRNQTKTVAPDDDPQFLRDLARKLAEEEPNQSTDGTESSNDK